MKIHKQLNKLPKKYYLFLCDKFIIDEISYAITESIFCKLLTFRDILNNNFDNI